MSNGDDKKKKKPKPLGGAGSISLKKPAAKRKAIGVAKPTGVKVIKVAKPKPRKKLPTIRINMTRKK